MMSELPVLPSADADFPEPLASGSVVATSDEGLTPRRVVAELDRYIVGQDDAKRAVAVALRNRWRRMQVEPPMRDEIMPNNIILIGATGVGKTEIARRLARLVAAPFVKVEATKFTERGYVGRDVESMVRDLVEASIQLVRAEHAERIEASVERAVRDRLLDMLLPPLKDPAVETQERWERSRKKLGEQLDGGELEARKLTLRVQQSGGPMLEIFSAGGGGDDLMGSGLGDALKNMMPKREKERNLPLEQAREILRQEEIDRRIDDDRVSFEAIDRAERNGIIFLDEIDKIASRQGEVQGADVSREGVQRDLLPVVEGSAVQTRYGAMKTDHVLFIAAGAFHMSKPSDLIPELQGRFPIRVELRTLTQNDFVRILREPENSLPRQYTALLATEGCHLEFREEGFEELARIAYEVNQRQENIGARRLHTIMSTLLEGMLFELPPEVEGDLPPTKVVVDGEFVRQRLSDLAEDTDLSRYIL
jgi:ATP-dependent HslUV protease ATP-binding subunit HslU